MFDVLEFGFVFCPGSSFLQKTTLCYTEYKGQWHTQSNKFSNFDSIYGNISTRAETRFQRHSV